MPRAHRILIKNAHIVNEGKMFLGALLIEGKIISAIFRGELSEDIHADSIIDATGKHLLPGVIDDQVHFREPGLTHKEDIHSGSVAAVAGGVTSFMEMPNTVPQTTSIERLENKFERAEGKSCANFSFYFGATNDNLHEILHLDKSMVCGIKVFMGSSTGNMLVDNPESLEAIFQKAGMLIAVHCEDEQTIKGNIQRLRSKFGDHIPVQYHPQIRNDQACYKSTALAIKLAKKHHTRLHVLHLSSGIEMELFEKGMSDNKTISSEVCIHHLWFSDEDYLIKGSLIKWNPSIKSKEDQNALWQALHEGRLDIIATDHAPHTMDEKRHAYLHCPSGGPLVQHALIAMLECHHQGKISIEDIVLKMCHAPALCFGIRKRGFLRKGYFADLVLVDLASPWTVSSGNLLYKCGWSPFEGQRFQARVIKTFVNGKLAFDNGRVNEDIRGEALAFDR